MGRIIGTAGASLISSKTNSFAVNSTVASKGALGEKVVAKIIEQLARSNSNVHVLHDIDIPLMKEGKANIDHIIINGNDIIIVDAKCWTPGVYFKIGRWCFRSTKFKKLERFTPGEKHTMDMALNKLGTYLEQKGVDATITESYLVVVPSDKRFDVNVRFYSPNGAKAISSDDFERKLGRIIKPSREMTDYRLFQALEPLVNGFKG